VSHPVRKADQRQDRGLVGAFVIMANLVVAALLHSVIDPRVRPT
jgi:hypothetical protein